MFTHNFLLGNFHTQFVESYSFEPDLMYCQVTGKPLGFVYKDELLQLVSSLDGDLESICDDIAVRIFASMRPSLHWNKMRVDSLKDLHESRPLETLAYLLNRLFAPVRSGAGMLAVNHDRIRLWQQLDQWNQQPATKRFLDTICYDLLELDAKVGLNEESPPFTVEAFLTKFESFELLIEMIQAWRDRRLKEYDRRVKQLELSSKWWRSGSALAKPAFATAWMRAQPLSQAKTKQLAKDEESKFMRGLLMGILGESTDEDREAVKPKPQLVPATKMPNWGAKR